LICFALLMIYLVGVSLFDDSITRGRAISSGAVIISFSHPLALQSLTSFIPVR
jgi:hypothetical protein